MQFCRSLFMSKKEVEMAEAKPDDMEAQVPETEGLTTGQTVQISPMVTHAATGLMGGIISAVLLVAFIFFFDATSAPGGVPEEGVGHPLNFLVVGDWGRRGEYNQSIVAAGMGKVGAAVGSRFVISTGDNFYDRGLTSLDDPLFTASFTDIYTAESLQTPWYAVLGNHDYMNDPTIQAHPELRRRDARWHLDRFYTLKKSLCPQLSASCNASVEFFFFDTNPFLPAYYGKLNFTDLLSQETEVEKIVNNLRNALQLSQSTWKVVVGHHPIRSLGEHGDTPQLVDKIEPLLMAERVDLYLNGHDHALELIVRPEAPIPLVTSGAGSMCYRPQSPALPHQGLEFDYNGQGFVSVAMGPRHLSLDFHDLHGDPLHNYIITKKE